MLRLCQIASKEVRTVVGLMSGTSHDGVDAAIVRITGAGAAARVELAGLYRSPYPPTLRARVAQAFDGRTEDICRLNFELGEFFARAALKAISKAGMTPAGIDIIGSHGQTVYHIPPRKGKPGSTLQIGEGAVIASRTGILTVSDFRPADVAAGGQGAPLVPYADWVLFRKPGQVTAVHNIGGISNVTVVTERLNDVYGFDTGPGCSLLDEAIKILTSGKKTLDSNGKIAGSGVIIQDLLTELLSNPYFRQKPPKSTGRETFGRDLVENIIRRHKKANIQDILCTLTHLTAESVRLAYEKFVFPRHKVDRVILAGGGVRNNFLAELIGGLLPVPVGLTDSCGIPAEAREALAFAVLANETVAGNASNVPGATGANTPAVLGKISV
ncbi:MAG: anhydro-N-acetylmuramic acid kinase [Nitrospirota bacterium]